MTDVFYQLALEHWNASGKRHYSWITRQLEPLTAGDKVEIDRAAGELRRAAQSSAPEEERCERGGLPLSMCHCAVCGPKRQPRPADRVEQ
jgi:hypothetical protein